MEVYKILAIVNVVLIALKMLISAYIKGSIIQGNSAPIARALYPIINLATFFTIPANIILLIIQI